MPDFYQWRGCEINDGKAVVDVNARVSDAFARAVALMTEKSSVPDDNGPPATAIDNVRFSVSSAAWSQPIADPNSKFTGTDTYDYALLPINTKTGKTGKPVAMPPLTISAGQSAILSVVFPGQLDPDVSVILMRDGEAVGPAMPISQQVQPTNVNVQPLPAAGTYSNAFGQGFFDLNMTPPLIAVAVNDYIIINGSTVVKVTGISGNLLSFFPPQFFPIAATGTFQKVGVPSISFSPWTWLFSEAGQFASNVNDISTATNDLRTTIDETLGVAGYTNTFDQVVATAKCEEVGAGTSSRKALPKISRGMFARPTNSKRLYAINKIVKADTAISLTAIRAVAAKIAGGSLTDLFAIRDGLGTDPVAVAIYRREERVLPAAECPPGQPNSTQVVVVFDRMASRKKPVLDGEEARVLWKDTLSRVSTKASHNLRLLGLTATEIDGAVRLEPAGRVTQVTEFNVSSDVLEDLDNLRGELGEDDSVEVFDDLDITDIDLGKVDLGQVQDFVTTIGGRATNRYECGLDVAALPALAVFSNIGDPTLTFNICFGDPPPPEIAAALAALDNLSAALGAAIDTIRGIYESPAVLALLNMLTFLVNALLNNQVTRCLLGPVSFNTDNPLFNGSIDLLWAGLLPLIEAFLDQVEFYMNLFKNVFDLLLSGLCIISTIFQSLFPDASKFLSKLECLLGGLPELALIPPNIAEIIECNSGFLELLDKLMNEVVLEFLDLISLARSLRVGIPSGISAAGLGCGGPDVVALQVQLGKALGL